MHKLETHLLSVFNNKLLLQPFPALPPSPLPSTPPQTFPDVCV